MLRMRAKQSSCRDPAPLRKRDSPSEAREFRIALERGRLCQLNVPLCQCGVPAGPDRSRCAGRDAAQGLQGPAGLCHGWVGVPFVTVAATPPIVTVPEVGVTVSACRVSRWPAFLALVETFSAA